MAKIKSVIGFEVDSNEIRAVEVNRSNGVFSILACGKIPLQEGVIEEGFIRDADRFNIALTELMQNGGFKATNVVVGVNNENVVMRYATFPKVSDDKLRNMVLLQAQEFIPIPVQEMEIDYVVAGDGVNEDEQPVTNVMLVAARRNMIEQYINILSASRLQVIDVDATVLSLCRGLRAGVVGDEKYAVLNLTEDLVNFIVIEKNEISMVRSIQIPERIEKSVERLFAGKEEGDDVESVGTVLGQETSSSVSYYAMQNQGNPIEKIFLLTSLDKNDELVRGISEIFANIPVVVPNYYTKNNFGLDQHVINEFAGCIGLAIQALEVK
jgi:type IV pilus assembly protein PilM